MKRIDKKNQSLAILYITITCLFLSIFLSSCSVSIDKKIKQDLVNTLYIQALSSEETYGDEPEPGSTRSFPASFAFTGKILLIEKPIFNDMEPRIPVGIYDEFDLRSYIWYTENPEEIQYIVLLEVYYNPADEWGQGNSLIFTIVDLSYNEIVYKSFLTNEEDILSPPYKKLADLLESLVL